ncbi:UDP-4-amino-4,6-dideoxy-N-acetyl-beta-L-altrosamine transaminase [Sagittula marina]|uniref:UDP-4-amino-4, 6-dideoxy-N-acetyl-beta-L-altrosamine transaminase n=1 Tax=Sagittula marina TaxID=943940 RepID=A0A7W6GS19_9RHOB|nr:UDP-4-amino-4,6-dideoxy-N-acetyl-beta-L-altrosamine transaminase [Sagittula marina]MBB3985158.1 UDP-4-amino-4,6-dideoxy-N-acetyl-beta-L-altrosamine transaminase [Sagittula marina]
MIPYGRQDISEEDRAAVDAVLRSDFLTQGPAVPRFEEALAARVGASHAVAVNSATSALHMAVAALGLGQGDLLWTTPITFVASANCGRYCGADVDFVDIDPETFNMCADALEAKLAIAEAAGRLPKVIVPVHMCGQSPDMIRIGALARRYGVRVVEDASHAIGADYDGKPVGDCAHSDVTVFSFHPVKIITTAEGGLATTNDPALAERMALLRSHGITRDDALMTEPSHGPWYYQQIDLGWNYRMTEMQAALGLSQLSRLDPFVARRRALADRYDNALQEMPLSIPGRDPKADSAWHLYVIRLHDKTRHRAVFERLRDAGIGVNLHYIPVHLQPYYKAFGFAEGDFPQSEDYYARAISIPLYAGLSDAMQDEVIAALTEALS